MARSVMSMGVSSACGGMGSIRSILGTGWSSFSLVDGYVCRRALSVPMQTISRGSLWLTGPLACSPTARCGGLSDLLKLPVGRSWGRMLV